MTLALGLVANVARADQTLITPVAGENFNGAERLANPGFEQGTDTAATPWYGWMQGYEVLPTGGRNASRAVRCAAGTPDDQHGASQPISLKQDVPRPILVTGWSRAENVDGTPDNGYSIYLDITYRDGSHLWGHTASFSVGTHDWEQRRIVLAPEKPIESLTLHALFRGHNGSVSFDDFSLREMDAAGAMFENVVVSAFHAPPPSGDTVHVGAADGLDLALDRGSGAIASLGLKNAPLGEAGFPLFARDVGADSAFVTAAPGTWHCVEEQGAVRVSGDLNSLQLRLSAAIAYRDGLIDLTGHVEDLRGTERAVTVYVPFPVTGDWRWLEDLRRDKAAQGTCINSFRTGAGATGARSSYPLAALSGPKGGIALAVPMDEPRHHRLVYDADHGLFYAAFDLGLSPETRLSPGAASFRVLLFTFDPAWRFRGALDRYYRLFPASFEKRVPLEGLWMAFTDISTVPHYEDFHFAYQEGPSKPAWDREHGFLAFPYTEPMTTWLKLPSETPRDFDGAMGYLGALLEKPDDPLHESASVIRTSSVHDSAGRSIVSVVNAPWCDGCVFALNADPSIPVSAAGQLNRGQAELRRLEAAEGDGTYIDSYEFWANSIDYNRTHFTQADIPLVFDAQSHQVGVLTLFSTFAFQRELANRMHAQGKLMMANGALASYDCCAAFLDVLGTETNWMPGGKWQPMTDAELCFRRALSFQKPYCFLMNTHYADFTLELTERYMQRALAYGMFPGFFSENAATDCYFATPAYYEAARPLFKKYLPLIQAIAKAGWQPITFASSDAPEVYVERFGESAAGVIYLSLLNDSAQARTARVQVDWMGLGLRENETAVHELISDTDLTQQNGAPLALELKAEAAALLRLSPGKTAQ